MIKVKEYKTRKLAEAASSFLMSKGIAAVVKGYVVVPAALNHLKQEKVELMVPDHLYNKTIELLSLHERNTNEDNKNKW